MHPSNRRRERKDSFARLSVVVAVVCSFLPCFVIEAATHTLGGPGGAPFRIACGQGRYVVGLTGRAGDWMDQVAPICVEVDVDGRWVGDPAPGPSAGGSGGGPFTTLCPRDFIVTDFQGYAEGYVYNLGLTCRQNGANGPTWESASPSLVGGNLGVSSTAGGGCGANHFADAIIGGAGAYVDRFGLDCAFRLGRPTPAPVPVPIGERVSRSLSEKAFSRRALPDGAVLQTDGIAPSRAVPPPPAAPTSYPLRCRAGAGMTTIRSADGTLRIFFSPSPQGTAATAPQPGQCGWLDREFREGEPPMLLIAGGTVGLEGLEDLVKAGGSFSVRVYNDGAGAMVVTGLGD